MIAEGSTDKHAFFIRKGMVRSFSSAQKPDSEEITFQLFPENHVFGNLHAIFLDAPSEFTYVTLERTKVYIIDHDTFVEVTSRDPDLFGMNRKLMGKRLMKQAFTRLESFVFLSPEERYLKYVQDYPHVINRAPDKYIAHILGITPTSLSRIRKRLASQKK